MEVTTRRVPRQQQESVSAEGRSSRENEVSGEIPSPPVDGNFDTGLGLVWERSGQIPSGRTVDTEVESITAEGISEAEMHGQGAVGADTIQPTAPQFEEIDAVIDDYNVQKDRVVEQHALIQSKKEYIKQSKENERTKIIALFSNILDILADKEASLLCKLDEMYKPDEDKVEELLTSVEDALESIRIEINVAEAVKTGDNHFKDVTMADMKPLLCDIRTGIEEREEELRDDNMQAVEINEEVINVINGLQYVNIPETNIEEEESNLTAEGGVDENSSEIGNLEGEPVPVFDSERTEGTDERSSESIREEPQNDTAENEVENAASSVDSRHEQVDSALLSPSAPPMPQPQEEEDPPPYWQAIGLSGPEAANLPRSPAPGSSPSDNVPPYSNTASGGHLTNELVCYHNFPLKREYDARSPKPVALAWNLDSICVADRANSKLKFFSSTGGVLTEMYLGGCEIYDISFLEADGNELRYVVTVPRAKTLLFISLIGGQAVRLLQKLKLRQGYTCIAKGPTGNTLVGANALPNVGEPRVDIVNFQGQVLRSFKHIFTNTDIRFSYPKCVEVYEQAIVVADWKLSLVVVLLEDGTGIGQYCGTSHFPLKEPNSLTFDHFGNIMVVDGKTGNIHVIDMQCRPLEIIKSPRGQSIPKLLAFHASSRRLAVARQSGDIAIYDFRGGYQTASYNDSVVVSSYAGVQMSEPNVLPLVEGMLPSTIASIGAGRQRQSVRSNAWPQYQGVLPQYQGVAPQHQVVFPQNQGVLPSVAGMLPSTVASIGSGRQRQNNRNYTFHL